MRLWYSTNCMNDKRKPIRVVTPESSCFSRTDSMEADGKTHLKYAINSILIRVDSIYRFYDDVRTHRTCGPLKSAWWQEMVSREYQMYACVVLSKTHCF